MDAFLTSLGLVFVAELGDKTQLVALGLAARYPLRSVLVGVGIAYLVTQGLAAAVGGLLGAALPSTAIAIGAGVLFLVFAVLTLRGDDDDGQLELRGRSVVVSVAALVFVAEIGDKTMLTTATLAARGQPVIVWAGATFGIAASGALAIGVGHVLGRTLPSHIIRKVAAALFAVFGVWLLVGAALEIAG